MLTEQIIEFELRGPGLSSRTCTPKPGYFHDRTKISKANPRVIDYSLLKILHEKMYLASSTWAKSLTKFTSQIQDFKRFLDLICK